ncbi:NucA/NucB deoxyribonuclease domain-containing protein [Streptomyces mirabilis]|uniref:NucA/NucB deoxyribonuclease domain-containing protein n=1 Tax=Streptomyces mirabilis TaxID=68239 RepID=UPI0033A88713
MHTRATWLAFPIGLVLALLTTGPKAWAASHPLTVGADHRTTSTASPVNPAVDVDCPQLSRSTACESHIGSVTVTIDGNNSVPVGYAITIIWHTNARSPRFTADVHVKTAGVGFPGLINTITADCQKPCSSSGSVTGPLSSYQPQQWGGTLSFDDAVATDQQHVNQVTFKASAMMPPLPGHTLVAHPSKPGVASTTVRCDDMRVFKGPPTAGCVIPTYTPTMTTMAGLPAIAANIRGIQMRGGMGVPGDTARALHRLTDQRQRDRNRDVACDEKVTGPKRVGMSCDEYPFASTREGGFQSGMTNGWAWVPAKEQNAQGGLLITFYTENRVIDGDAFYVQV